MYSYRTDDKKVWSNAIQIDLYNDIIFLEQQGNEIIIYTPKSPDVSNLISSFNYLLSTLHSVCNELRMTNLTFEVFIP